MDEGLRRLIALGREHYRSRDYDAAEKLFSAVLAQVDGVADVHNMLGVIHHDRGRVADAERAFERALEINPRYTEAALNLSVVLNDQGKYERAREFYARAVSHSQEPHTENGVDPYVKGKLANLHADLGAAYFEHGLHAEAVREYRRALELCPTFIDLRTRLAAVLRDQGDLAAAAAELEKVRGQNPAYIPARLALGAVYYGLERRPDAVAEWRAVLDLDGENRAARAYLRMASELERR
jgi:tetratricopeptide (TPR) repeat protein